MLAPGRDRPTGKPHPRASMSQPPPRSALSAAADSAVAIGSRHYSELMPKPAKPKVTIYTDGACAGNGTPQSRGGWAAILVYDDTGQAKEFSGGERPSSNQKMEIMAVIEGLKALKKPCAVTVFADSAYVINCMNDGWFVKWRKNGWVDSKKKPVVNRELWEQLLDAVENRGHTVRFEKVPGHADLLGHALTVPEQFNLRCDDLAVAACPSL
jgi:ribonuclease HI